MLHIRTPSNLQLTLTFLADVGLGTLGRYSAVSTHCVHRARLYHIAAVCIHDAAVCVDYAAIRVDHQGV
ncbi:hypothetical protein EB796_010850 [Bugula neritina]|uniref:Uncharacterized protein n=1 Tax=Bugula neritina TaxID=10212 RepID=A0A7J7JZT6_BUGNE|nr:hypothetical protein EB796_010850 [Bugula neritina]